MNEEKVAMFVSNSSHSLWNFRLAPMRLLKGEGYRVIAVSPSDKFVAELKSEFEFIELKKLSRKGRDPFRDMKLTLELFGLFKLYSPKVVFSYTIKPNIYSTIACRFCNTKVVCFITGLGYTFLKGGFLLTLVKWLYKFALKKAYRVVFLNNEDFQDFVEQKLIKSSQGVVFDCGEGVDTEHFFYSPPDFSIPRTYLFIGRLLKDKGIVEFLHAAEELKKSFPKTRFVVLGDPDFGNPASLTKGDLSSWKLKKIADFIPNVEDVRPFIRLAHFIVLPSYLEGKSRVLMESLSVGRGIIASNVRGCKEFIAKEKNGFAVEARDLVSLQKALRCSLELSNEDNLNFCLNSREMAAHNYGLQKVIECYRELLF